MAASGHPTTAPLLRPTAETSVCVRRDRECRQRPTKPAESGDLADCYGQDRRYVVPPDPPPGGRPRAPAPGLLLHCLTPVAGERRRRSGSLRRSRLADGAPPPPAARAALPPRPVLEANGGFRGRARVTLRLPRHSGQQPRRLCASAGTEHDGQRLASPLESGGLHTALRADLWRRGGPLLPRRQGGITGSCCSHQTPLSSHCCARASCCTCSAGAEAGRATKRKWVKKSTMNRCWLTPLQPASTKPSTASSSSSSPSGSSL